MARAESEAEETLELVRHLDNYNLEVVPKPAIEDGSVLESARGLGIEEESALREFEKPLETEEGKFSRKVTEEDPDEGSLEVGSALMKASLNVLRRGMACMLDFLKAEDSEDSEDAVTTCLVRTRNLCRANNKMRRTQSQSIVGPRRGQQMIVDREVQHVLART